MSPKTAQQHERPGDVQWPGSTTQPGESGARVWKVRFRSLRVAYRT